MKNIYPLPFILMGVVFLLVSTVFYPSVSSMLTDTQSRMDLSAPPFWNLSLVLSIVRIIFIFVGIFLTAFGLGLFWWVRRKEVIRRQ